MKKFSKKLMALAMAGVMMCSPIMAAAADVNETDKATALAGGSSTGSGKVEGWVDSEVFIVVLPTEAEDNTTYNFTLDPQHLLYKTKQEGYTQEDVTVWFSNKSNTSDTLSAKSKSNIPVELSVTAAVSGLKGTTAEIVMTDDNKFTGDTSTSLYMGVTMDGTTVAIPTGKTDAKASYTFAALDDDQFEFKHNEDGSYSYDLKEDSTAVEQADFALTAACNDAADWGAVVKDEGIAPKVIVAWSMKPHVDYPETDGTTDIVINYTGAKPANGSIKFTTPNGGTWTPPATQYTSGNITVTASTITIKGSWLLTGVAPSQGFGTYTFTLNGETYGFIVEVVPSTNGTSDIVISYTGTKPANGSLAFTTPNGGTWTPPATHYTNGNITVADSTITIKGSWLQGSVATSQGFGTYTFTLNGATYKFKVTE